MFERGNQLERRAEKRSIKKAAPRRDALEATRTNHGSEETWSGTLPELFPILRSLIDRNPSAKFVILGSASPTFCQEFMNRWRGAPSSRAWRHFGVRDTCEGSISFSGCAAGCPDRDQTRKHRSTIEGRADLYVRPWPRPRLRRHADGQRDMSASRNIRFVGLETLARELDVAPRNSRPMRRGPLSERDRRSVRRTAPKFEQRAPASRHCRPRR
jgi:hypothetical protein